MVAVHRRKVMIIPFTEDGKPLMVKDRKTLEWGFISGGVKINESPFEGACRELSEETSGLYKTIPSFHRRIEFNTSYRPKQLRNVDKSRRETVISTYYIYLFRACEFINDEFKPNKEVVELKFEYYTNFNTTWEWSDYVFKYII